MPKGEDVGRLSTFSLLRRSLASQQLNVGFMDAYGELAGVDNESWVIFGEDGPVSTPQLQYIAGDTSDGVSPDAAGGAVLTQAVMTPIQNSGRAGVANR